ncbi:MAG: GTPase ObgE [Candidatus Geothermincolia bacterium]
MFIDEAEIYVEGGRGGDGCASFLREKYRPHGGPDGGDGGGGGGIVLEATNSVRTLVEYSRRRHFRANRGGRGGSKNKKGPRGTDTVLMVPVGTVVRDEDGRVIADLVEAGQKFLVADGGRPGRGNAGLVHEAGPLPRFAEKGEPGRARRVKLELKLIADVAIVGFPNAGKSSLISRISRARPKIADYPFTTIEPNLGVVVGEDSDFVVTDVPGLIEGAHEGRGMGIAFLRHIERASVILYLVDMSPMSGRRPVDDLVVLEGEMGDYSPELLERRRLVAANKMDVDPDAGEIAELRAECVERGLELYEISAVTGQGLQELVGALAAMVEAAREEGVMTGETILFEPSPAEETMTVERADGRFIVRGGRVERLVLMTDWENDEARAHLARRLRDVGVEDVLARNGAEEGDEIEIAGKTFEYIPEGARAKRPGAAGTAEDG